MALFARVAKLGSGAYGMRHAKVRPSVMQFVLAIRETVVIKPSRLNIVVQALSNSLPLCLPLPLHTHISLKKRGHAASTLNTHRQASLKVSCSMYTCPTPEVVHWGAGVKCEV